MLCFIEFVMYAWFCSRFHLVFHSIPKSTKLFMMQFKRRYWPPWWLLLLCWLQREVVENMVLINCAGLAGPQAADMLLAEGAQRKMQVKTKKGMEKDLDVSSAREVRERFPEYSYVDAYVRRIGNATLFSEIRHGKVAAAKSGKRLSTVWWSNLRLKWQRINSPESLLTITNSNEPVPTSLVQALQAATSSNTRQRSALPLISSLATVASCPGQKATVGLYRHSLSKCPSSGAHLNTAIGLMKMVARLRVHVAYPRKSGAMHDHWDVSCCAWLSSVTRQGLKEETFLDQNLEVCSLIVNSAHVKAILAADDPAHVTEELKSICTSTTLGARIFGQVLSRLACKSYVKEITEICESCFKTDVNQASLNEAYSRAAASAAKWEYDLRCRTKS